MQTRFVKIPDGPWTFGKWFVWYINSEPRYCRNHSTMLQAQRSLTAIDAVRDRALEIREDDLKTAVDWLTDENEPPKCGFFPEELSGVDADGRPTKMRFPGLAALDYIAALKNSTAERPAKAEPATESTNETAQAAE